MTHSSLPILLSLCAIGSVAVLVLSRPVEPEIHTQRPDAFVAAQENAPISFEGYTELKMNEIYLLPAGPRGLEFTPKTQSLHGAKVRVEGHMVRHFHEDAAIFLFADVPASHNQAEYMLADSLPTSLVHVILPIFPGRAPAWRRERLTVFGTLELGSHQEIDGRISHVRLIADHVADAKTQEPIELRRPVALQRDRMASGVRTLFHPQKGDLTAQTQSLNTTQTSR